MLTRVSVGSSLGTCTDLAGVGDRVRALDQQQPLPTLCVIITFILSCLLAADTGALAAEV
jgi:hypothetical protein